MVDAIVDPCLCSQRKRPEPTDPAAVSGTIAPRELPAVPLYADRQELKNRPERQSWVDIDDVEFFTLGNADREAQGEEPPPTQWPDPVSDPEASLHTTHNIPVARRIVPTTPKERLVVVAGEAADGQQAVARTPEGNRTVTRWSCARL